MPAGCRCSPPVWGSACSLAGNLFGLAPAFLSMPALALYGIGWISFGRLLTGTEPSVPAPAGRGHRAPNPAGSPCTTTGRAATTRYPVAATWTTAAALWLLIWLHGARTHGLTQENEKRLWLGLTWMDSAKFLVVPFAVLLVAIFLLGRRQRPGSRAGRFAWVASLVAITLQVVAVALDFWPFHWGSYELGFTNRIPATGFDGPFQPVLSLVLTGLMVPLAATFVRAQVIQWWAAPALVVGMLSTFFLTPVSWLPAVCWLVVALSVVATRSR